jgi:hypothetical protein
MRAREFVTESRAEVAPEHSGPMQNTYVLPGLSSQDPYRTYRFGVAMARARASQALEQDGVAEPFEAEGAFGELAVVSGFDSGVEEIIDQALAMTDTPGGRVLVGSKGSNEPATVTTKSPINSFKGYPR